jgi:hypothetical protein
MPRTFHLALLGGLLLAPLPLQQATRAPRWTAVRDLRIGDESDTNYIFQRISSVQVGTGGEMTVIDSRALSIRRFDARGRLTHRFGRRGAGPGEFRSIRAAGVLGDTLWVADGTLNRVTFFSPTGAVLKTIPLLFEPRHQAFSASTASALLTDGSVVVAPDMLGEVAAQTPDLVRPLVRLARDGQVRDTIAQLRVGRPALLVGGWVLAFQPFADTPLWKAQPNGVSLVFVDRTVRGGRTPTYTVRRMAADGRTLFDRQYPYTPQPIPRAEVDSVIAAAVQEFSDPTPPVSDLARVLRERMELPAHRPPVSRVVVGRDGTTFVGREGGSAQSLQWDILDERGERIGELSLPSQLRVLAADRDHVWGFETDEMDVATVVRYTLRKPGQ